MTNKRLFWWIIGVAVFIAGLPLFLPLAVVFGGIILAVNAAADDVWGGKR